MADDGNLVAVSCVENLSEVICRSCVVVQCVIERLGGARVAQHVRHDDFALQRYAVMTQMGEYIVIEEWIVWKPMALAEEETWLVLIFDRCGSATSIS